jgi:hypothetical protein
VFIGEGMVPKREWEYPKVVQSLDFKNSYYGLSIWIRSKLQSGFTAKGKQLDRSFLCIVTDRYADISAAFI